MKKLGAMLLSFSLCVSLLTSQPQTAYPAEEPEQNPDVILEIEPQESEWPAEPQIVCEEYPEKESISHS